MVGMSAPPLDYTVAQPRSPQYGKQKFHKMTSKWECLRPPASRQVVPPSVFPRTRWNWLEADVRLLYTNHQKENRGGGCLVTTPWRRMGSGGRLNKSLPSSDAWCVPCRGELISDDDDDDSWKMTTQFHPHYLVASRFMNSPRWGVVSPTYTLTGSLGEWRGLWHRIVVQGLSSDRRKWRLFRSCLDIHIHIYNLLYLRNTV
jgi:hypothetical protein